MVGKVYSPMITRLKEKKAKAKREARNEFLGSLAVVALGSVVAYFGFVICALLDQGVM